MPLDPYASHIPILAAVASRCAGRILEIGAGWYSTPMLHGIAAARGFEITTVETHQFYYYLLADLISEFHEIVMVSKSADYFISDSDIFGMAFIDNDDCPRSDFILKLKDKCPFIIAHDTQNLAPNYGFNNLDGVFKYRVDFKFKYLQIDSESVLPWTTVFSDSENLDWLRKAFPEHGEQ